MKAVLLLGTATIGVLAVQWLLSGSRKPTLTENQLEEKVHELKGKFKSLDEVQFDAATTGSDNSGYSESLHT
jgi:hypothetical protein